MKRGASSSDCNTVRKADNKRPLSIHLIDRIAVQECVCQPLPDHWFALPLDAAKVLARPLVCYRASEVLRWSDIVPDREPVRRVRERDAFVGQHHRDRAITDRWSDLQKYLIGALHY